MSAPTPRSPSASTRWWSPILQRWRAIPLRTRVHALFVFAAVVAAVGHQAVLWTWYIEDAAISFAYARNLAHGEGLVPFAGGERVEGYSNPTWVFLLAFFELFGWASESSARWLQAGIAALTVPVVYLIAREAAPRERSALPLFAVFLLAGSAQFAIWGSSGLENGLFNLFLALGLWRLAVEAREGGWPWSAWWFFLLAISRPEGILYGAVGGFLGMVFQLEARRGLLPTLKWLATFFVPFFAYQAWRYNYFAWAFPNTYYAKLGDHREPQPLAWDKRGWKYVRNWAHELGVGYFLPVLFLGITGARRWRPLPAVLMSLVLGIAILLPGEQRLLLPVVLGFTFAVFYTAMSWQSGDALGRPPRLVTAAGLLLVAGFIAVAEYLRAQGAESQLSSPEWLANAPPYVLLGAFVLMPLVGVRTPGWQARTACWGTMGVAVFFASYAMGDWMKGFRWLSLATVPGSVVLASGVVAVGDLVQRAFGNQVSRWTIPGWATAVVLVGGMIAPNVAHTSWLNGSRETSPYSVKRRVDYKQLIRERLLIDERIVDLDIDQGAHLWWSDHYMLDLAGLVDVPLAQHRFERAFVREYIFEEHKPHLAHVHGGWANSSRIPTHPEWARDYFEVPGYPVSKRQLHVGNFIRRDLVMKPSWKEGLPDRGVTFEGGVELVGWDVPSPEAARGRRFYIEVAFRIQERRTEDQDFRVLLFLHGDNQVASWDIPMGYDWLPPHKWKPSEIFHGRYALELPNKVPEGEYGLGFAVLAADGTVLPVVGELPERAVAGTEDAHLALGEVRFDDGLQVVKIDQLRSAATADYRAALKHAADGRCEDAERSWWLARMHHPRAYIWADQRKPEVTRAFADCWVGRAAVDPEREVDHLARARQWDHHAPSLLAAARPVADKRYAAGMQARAEEDYEAAYRAFSDVLRIDASRSWARRYAEEARAVRLGFDPATKARKEAERLERQRQSQERLEARKRAQEEAKAKDVADRDDEDGTDGAREADRVKKAPAGE